MTMILKARQLGISLQKRKGMRYEGRVYDGPLEGRNYASERPWFDAVIAPGSSCDLGFLKDSELVDPIAYDVVKRYRWSAPLRAWVLESGT